MMMADMREKYQISITSWNIVTDRYYKLVNERLGFSVYEEDGLKLFIERIRRELYHANGKDDEKYLFYRAVIRALDLGIIGEEDAKRIITESSHHMVDVR